MSNADTHSVAEAAKILGVSPSAVYQLCQARRIGHYRVGLGRGTIRVEAASLADYRKDCRFPSIPPPQPIQAARKRPASRIDHSDIPEVKGFPPLELCGYGDPS